MEAALQWLAQHGKETLETGALIVSLFLSSASFRADAKERKISNLMALANSHREIWTRIDERPDLVRIMQSGVDLSKDPVSRSEKRYVHFLITHFAVSYAAVKSGLVSDMEGLRKDVKRFFSLPIPAEVWKWSREYQSGELVKFVDECLRGRRRRRGVLSALRLPRR